jgi:hypothetical protein
MARAAFQRSLAINLGLAMNTDAANVSAPKPTASGAGIWQRIAASDTAFLPLVDPSELLDLWFCSDCQAAGYDSV